MHHSWSYEFIRTALLGIAILLLVDASHFAQSQNNVVADPSAENKKDNDTPTDEDAIEFPVEMGSFKVSVVRNFFYTGLNRNQEDRRFRRADHEVAGFVRIRSEFRKNEVNSDSSKV